MQVHELMHTSVQCCRLDSTLVEVAREMVDQDCGLIPVLEGLKPVGVITDRDIANRTVSKGKTPFNIRAREIMSTRLVTVHKNASVEQCCGLMGEHHRHRLLVVGDGGELAGIVSIDDVIRSTHPAETGHLACESGHAAAHP
jgi:CBS domain-containing protein